MNREAWLNKAVTKMRPWFEAVDAPLPEHLYVSVGWPSSRALSARKKRVGECWSPAASADKKTHHIFISPSLEDGVTALDVLVHELVHAAVGTEAGHKAPFKRVAVALGLEGKMTATVAGPELEKKLKTVVQQIGDYPHAALSGTNKKKQSTRLLKLECGSCGYIVRTTAKWVEVGLPTCCCGGWFESG